MAAPGRLSVIAVQCEGSDGATEDRVRARVMQAKCGEVEEITLLTYLLNGEPSTTRPHPHTATYQTGSRIR